jgi:hypothetical protein
MKVSITTPEGVSVELDVSGDEVSEAANLVRNLGAPPAEKPAPPAESLSLTPGQRDVYQVLLDHDCPDGCHITGISAVLETGYGATNQVLLTLVKRGLAVRVTRGHYRAAASAGVAEVFTGIMRDMPRPRAV